MRITNDDRHATNQATRPAVRRAMLGIGAIALGTATFGASAAAGAPGPAIPIRPLTSGLLYTEPAPCTVEMAGHG